MFPVLICVLVSLSVADNSLDTLYPELEHSRTIYVTGERPEPGSVWAFFPLNREIFLRLAGTFGFLSLIF